MSDPEVPSAPVSVVRRPEPSAPPTQPPTQELKAPFAHRGRSTLLVCLTMWLAGCDDHLLPASFRALESDLKMHPTKLALLSFSQALFFALSLPFWGISADRSPRNAVLGIGCIMWGIMTCIFASSSAFVLMFIIRALNGIALGSVPPVGQSLLADMYGENERGMAFGWAHSAASLGRLVGGVTTTTISNRIYFKIHGWRLAFFAVGLLSLAMGIAIWFLLEETQWHKHPALRKRRRMGSFNSRTTPPLSRRQSVLESFAEVMNTEGDTFTGFARYLRVPSVLLLLSQGIFGNIPWSAFAFLTMYIQYCGVPDRIAALCMSGGLLAAACGGFIAGPIGDRLYSWSEDHGRQYVAQLGVLIKVPLITLFFTLPREPSSAPYFILLTIPIGFSTAFVGSAAIQPILATLVETRFRGTIFSLVGACDVAVGALLGAPLVAFLSEYVFGYVPTDQKVWEMSDEFRLQNAGCLAQALLCTTAIPWSICFLIFSGLHMTVPRDRKKLQETRAARFAEANGKAGDAEAAEGETFTSPEVRWMRPSERTPLVRR
ncbi:unnamed protein product [Vitrella brassicaformis CCMP3155]|uniref:Major facilitator superfamily (MFS) profile domain-containing protein n=2 Tax=Vitrella brassicaformis TaxID=1169539 RepID=A0A0G4FEW3_VITBC|nr:unnamed protein product [Vitrella brassicaformis CCMP3155]|eukprot:CEM11780.1 unnamed protein product [Vitrella brassicaformis CCMP3155]